MRRESRHPGRTGRLRDGHPAGGPTLPGRVPPRVTVTNDESYYRDGRSEPLHVLLQGSGALMNPVVIK